MTTLPNIEEALHAAQQRGLVSKKKVKTLMSAPDKNVPRDPDHPNVQTLKGLITALIVLLIILFLISGGLYLRNQSPLLDLPI